MSFSRKSGQNKVYFEFVSRSLKPLAKANFLKKEIVLLKGKHAGHRPYLHIQLNATLSSIESIGMCDNSVPLLAYFKLLFTTK